MIIRTIPIEPLSMFEESLFFIFCGLLVLAIAGVVISIALCFVYDFIKIFVLGKIPKELEDVRKRHETLSRKFFKLDPIDTTATHSDELQSKYDTTSHLKAPSALSEHTKKPMSRY